jgi:hypothetical protein
VVTPWVAGRRGAAPPDLAANRLSLVDAVLGIITGRPREPVAEGLMSHVGCRDIGHR